MGMYDNVKFESKCRNCGYILDKWQTKDKECLLRTYEAKDVNNFYTICDDCGEWHEYLNGKLLPPTPKSKEER